MGHLGLITKMLYLQIWKDWWEIIVGNFDFRCDIDTPKDSNQEHVVRLSQCSISIRNQLISCSSSSHPHREKLLNNLLLIQKKMIVKVSLFKFQEFIVTGFLNSIWIIWLRYTFLFNLHLRGFFLCNRRCFAPIPTTRQRVPADYRWQKRGVQKCSKHKRKLFISFLVGCHTIRKWKLGVLLLHIIFFIFLLLQKPV